MSAVDLGMKVGSWAGVAAALLLAAMPGSTLPPRPALAAADPYLMDTVGGGPGQGTALGLNQAPGSLRAVGSRVYLTDNSGRDVSNPSGPAVRLFDPSTGTETLVAGGGSETERPGFGDGGPATHAWVDPRDVAVDGNGVVYLADIGVRRIDTFGRIGTLVSQDTLYPYPTNYPTSVAVDSANHLYVASGGSLYSVSSTGSLSQVTTGSAGPCATVGPGTGSLFIDAGGDFIWASTTGGIDEYSASRVCTQIVPDGTLNNPQGLTSDGAGGFYVSSTDDQVVDHVSASGVVTLVAGQKGVFGAGGDGGLASSATLDQPQGLAMVGSTLYIADHRNARLRAVNAAGLISTVAGNTASTTIAGDGGTATDAQIPRPGDVVADQQGSIDVASQGPVLAPQGSVRHIDTSGTISTIAGGGSTVSDGGPATASAVVPDGLATDSLNQLYIAGGNRVRRVDRAGTITTIAGTGSPGYSGDGGPATLATLGSSGVEGPEGVAADAAGDVFIADTGNDVVRKVNPQGLISTVVGNGQMGEGGDGGAARDASLTYPWRVLVTSTNELYIADSDSTIRGVVRHVNSSGTIDTVLGGGSIACPANPVPARDVSIRPMGLALDPSGRLIVDDDSNSCILVVAGGEAVTIAGNQAYGYAGDGGPDYHAGLVLPQGVTIGPDGAVYVADTGSGRVRRLSSATTPPAASTPCSPSAFTLVPLGDGRYMLHWTLGQNDGGRPALSLRIHERDTTNPAESRTDTVYGASWLTEAPLGGFIFGHTYAYSVSEVTIAGEGPATGETAPSEDTGDVHAATMSWAGTSVCPPPGSGPGGSSGAGLYGSSAGGSTSWGAGSGYSAGTGGIAGGASGYWLAASDGGIFPFGPAARGFGSTGGIHLNEPIVDMAGTPDGGGYWLVASDGGIFPFGDAPGLGSTGGIHLNKPIVGLAATPTGRGYWLVASDGGIFPFGDAGGYGSTGGIHLNQPIVGMTPTADGRGYWLVASDGGIFPFGDAVGYGSTGGIHLNRPIVGMAAAPTGRGYWLVASDGGIFPFGPAARGFGSTGGIHLNRPIVGMAATVDGNGYWLVASDGGIFPFGDAPGLGSTGGMHLNRPIVAMADA